MKQLLLSALILLAFSLPSEAMIIFDYQGDTVVRQKNVERNLVIKSDADGTYNVAIRPLDSALVSTDGKVSIPLENVYINNTREDVYMRYNEYSNLFSSLEMIANVPQNITAKVRDYGMVPTGTYQLNFEIQLTDTDSGKIDTTTFPMQMIVPVIQEMHVNAEATKITVGASDVFTSGKRIANEVPPVVQISSNCDWELSLNTDRLGETAGNLYVRTISATTNVAERLQERVLLEPNKEIIIARGKAPSDNESVTVEFSIENEGSGYMKAGNGENRVRYILREVN